MNWDQLVKQQAKQYKAFLQEYHQSLFQLNADIKLMLGDHSETTAPEIVKDKIARDRETWKAEWSMEGRRYRSLRVIHQRELMAFFAQADS